MGFYEEIKEQPQVLRGLAAYLRKENASLTEQLSILTERIKPTQIVFTGMGSSLFASEIPCSYLRRKGIRAYALEANELQRFDAPVIDERTILVAVSQSGNSMETVRFCEKYKEAPLITVTNQEKGNLAKYGDVRLFLQAGDEHFTSTKSYTNTVAALVYLAIQLAGDTPALPAFFDGVEACADTIAEIIADTDLAQRITGFFDGCRIFTLVGSGASYTTAEHGALVLLETTKTPSVSYTAGQFIHGPVEVIDGEFGCILFDFDPAVREETDRVLSLTDGFGGKTMILTDRNDLAENDRRLILRFPKTDPFLAPLAEIIPIELWAKFYGDKKGLTPGVLHRVHK